jgi:hypothetical protein
MVMGLGLKLVVMHTPTAIPLLGSAAAPRYPGLTTMGNPTIRYPTFGVGRYAPLSEIDYHGDKPIIN